MELMELLMTRRTYRRFEQKPVSGEILEEILESTRYASSAANRQPLSYVVVKEPEKVDAVFECTNWAGYLPREDGRPKEGEKPVLFIGVAQDTAINSACDTDAGLAISNMTLVAWSHGIGSCIIGACDKKKLGEMFGLTGRQVLHTVVAFGYPAHQSLIEDVKESGSIKYYLNENRDYVVPKRELKDVVKYY